MIDATARCSAVALRGVARVRELFNVVYETIQFPLPIDLRATAQREAIEPLVVAQIRKHRLYCRESTSILFASTRGIDTSLHAHGVRFAWLPRVVLDAAAGRGGLERYPNLVRVRAGYQSRPTYQRALEKGGPYTLG